MVELITDRTQYHVTLLNRLRRKPWGAMTEAEKTAWNEEASKGAYNYTDLNRVESAVKELAAELGLNLVTKTNWTQWDIPVVSDMERYLGNVVAIRDACPDDIAFPSLPASMSGLTHVGANNIETVLLLAYQSITGVGYDNTLGKFLLGRSRLGEENISDATFSIRSGEVYCGEVL